MSIALYEFAPTRSQRARWTLLELEVPFESISGRELIGSERLRAVHPLAKLPAMTDDGRPLFESAAISIWLADSHPEKGLIAAAGTWERALHDQWVAFALTELEAHLWSTFRNTVVYPEERRVAAISEQERRGGEARAGRVRRPPGRRGPSRERRLLGHRHHRRLRPQLGAADGAVRPRGPCRALSGSSLRAAALHADAAELTRGIAGACRDHSDSHHCSSSLLKHVSRNRYPLSGDTL